MTCLCHCVTLMELTKEVSQQSISKEDITQKRDRHYKLIHNPMSPCRLLPPVLFLTIIGVFFIPFLLFQPSSLTSTHDLHIHHPIHLQFIHIPKTGGTSIENSTFHLQMGTFFFQKATRTPSFQFVPSFACACKSDCFLLVIVLTLHFF